MFTNIRNQRQFFWDEHFIDPVRTTARLMMHQPVKRNVVMVHDEPWEGDATIYHNIVNDQGLYRMYYLARKTTDPVNGLIIPGRVCYAESRDGLSWHKPALHICSYHGLYENNILLDEKADLLDNFFVFLDDNPAVPANQRYKGIAVSYAGAKDSFDVSLWCYISGDGLHFQKGWVISGEGTFDSLNTVVWNRRTQTYFCFFRGMHEGVEKAPVRDIRVMTSKDFKNWSEPERAVYNTKHDFQMYTNGVFQPGANDDMMVGLATRYVERGEWTPNYDALCGREKRLYAMKASEPRSGLALTDCIMMTSYDGIHWHRFDEAFLTPGIEKRENWVYGDCYPCIGLVPTCSDEPGAPRELSLYMKEGHQSLKPAVLYRYTVRRDGFASAGSGYEESVLVTKQFTYAGGRLSINFSTSAAGYIYIRVLDESCKPLEGYASCEVFGDSLCREIDFPNDLSLLSGKRIRLEFLMRDARLYSLIFN